MSRAGQGVSHTILAHLGRNSADPVEATARAKKAVACLYYVSGMGMEQIEAAMGRFGGAFDGSAGPIRNVTSRTCDVLPMIVRAAEILYAGIDLQERTGRSCCVSIWESREPSISRATRAGISTEPTTGIFVMRA